MLTTETKRHIDAARQVLVGVVPNPSAQIDQITNALIYKFMDDMDQSAIKAGGEPSFFIKDLERYSWTRLMDTRIGNQERMNLYSEALVKFSEAKQLPELFRNIFKSAFLPYRSPEVLGLFLKEIAYFDYSHSEELGNAYEYLLSIMGSQGDAGQFRTPRDIIDFIVEVVNPTKDDKVLDPACGTAGFLISAYKHILAQHDGKNADGTKNDEKPLTPDQRKTLVTNFEGYDVDPGMVRISRVNMYLHKFPNPKIFNYNTLAEEERWGEKFDVILANPPFMSPKGGVSTHNKFSVESNRSEVLFVDYIMNHLRPRGRAGIIVPEGIIFQSGTTYKQLRKNLVEDGLYAIASLPSGVFQPYSGVKTSILFFDNELVGQRSKLLFIDIKDIGVSLGTARRHIDKNDLVPALEIIERFRTNKEIEPSRLAFVAKKEEIIAQGYDLSLAKYRKQTASSAEKPIVALSEVCNVFKGKSSSTKTEPGNFTLLLTAEESKTADHFDFEGEGVCVPLISATGHGKAAIKRIHFVQGKFALANLLAFVEPKDPQALNAKYLYYCLDGMKDEMARLMNGAANVSMKTSDLETFQIPLPSLEVQEQIVIELDGYQNIINGARQVVENWKPVIGIESGWEIKTLDEISEMEYGYTDTAKESGDARFIRITDINESGELKNTDKKYIILTDESKKYLLNKDDVLMARTGATFGKTLLFRGDEKSVFASFLIRIKLEKKKILPAFYWAFSRSSGYWKQANALVTGGAQPQFNGNALKNIRVPLPPLEVQKQIVERVEAERALVESNKKLIEIYEQKTKDTLAKLWSE